jgi:RNA 2',3'-cyclic 3'-phosphodiesterase
LFFALWPESAVQQSLAETTQDVVRAAGGRAMPPEFFHVTLAFLGSVPEDRVSEVKAIADEVASNVAFDSVQVTLDVIEYWKKAGVLCATARLPSSTGGSPAEKLATALKSQLLTAGFAPDLKPFRPHVTLARKIPRGSHESTILSVPWSFTAFALVESRTGLNGSMYQVLKSFPLGTGQALHS